MKIDTGETGESHKLIDDLVCIQTLNIIQLLVYVLQKPVY